MPPHPAPPLPIDEALPALLDALAASACAVLQAPPGAGKTTRVPLALLGAPWMAGRTVLVLEPRRLAARAAARRMARTLGEGVGDTVGYRVRMDSRVGPRTRVEVVTEGVLPRLLHEDPALERVGAVLFDEFHERSLQGDLGLALTLDAQAVLRPDLRVLVMSATLDGGRVAALLGGGGPPAPVVASAGRAHPVAVHWAPRRPDAGRGALEAAAAATVRAALARHPGDALVFLPGAAEIRRTADLLAGGPLPGGARVLPLHGQLPPEAQDEAVAPSPPGARKVVLATSIAETSLTIEGVRVVVDAGLARVPRFSPRSGMTHLDTVRASRAAAEQRRGRAGRVAPGDCYRLWPEAEHHGLLPYAAPEVLEADLAPLALELAAAGVSDPAALRWLDLPPAAAFARARALLAQLGALDPGGRVTAHGRAMSALPLHPRLAHMLLRADALGAGAVRAACALAALLGERDVLRAPFGAPAAAARPDADLRLRLALVLGGGDVPAAVHGAPVDRAGVHRARTEARALADRVRPLLRAPGAGRRAAPAGAAVDAGDDALAGVLVALAYPDRVAQGRAAAQAPPNGRFLLRNGRGAALDADQPLARAPYLAVAELAGGPGDREPRIALAAPLSAAELEAHAAEHVERVDEVAWDAAAGAVRARQVERLGALVLRERPLASPDPDAVAAALLDGVGDAVRTRGLAAALPWSDAARGLRERVGFARHLQGDAWPDWSDAALAATLPEWLGPALAAAGARRWSDVEALDTAAVLSAALPWAQRAALDALAPAHVTVPTGSRVRVDYSAPDAPVLAVRLQELFGLADTPRVGGGTVALTLHLLSPAYRPVQVTRDLGGFWRTSYFDVRRDLRGRYPRHPWPEDPLGAAPTRRAKPRGT
jgi:ATP-dependent helicase HrpB